MTKIQRLYPNDWPSFPYEPTPVCFEVFHFADSHGEGLKILVPIKKGSTVFMFMGIVLPYQTLFTLQADKNTYIHDPYVMGKVLHSCEPNMVCDMKTRTFTALHDINEDDILTMDYETTEDVLYRPFTCHCGSKNCRGEIYGREERKKYDNKR